MYVGCAGIDPVVGKFYPRSSAYNFPCTDGWWIQSWQQRETEMIAVISEKELI